MKIYTNDMIKEILHSYSLLINSESDIKKVVKDVEEIKIDLGVVYCNSNLYSCDGGYASFKRIPETDYYYGEVNSYGGYAEKYNEDYIFTEDEVQELLDLQQLGYEKLNEQ